MSALVGLGLTLLAPAAGAEELAGAWVIPPGGEARLPASLMPDGEPLEGRWKVHKAKIQKDKVRVHWIAARGDAAPFILTLVHPSAASTEGRRLPDLSIEPTPGPVPAGFLDALVARIAAHPGALTWSELPPDPHAGEDAEEPPTEPAIDEAAAEREGELIAELRRRVHHLVHRGDALTALEEIRASRGSSVKSPDARAELAVLHALAGDAEGAKAIATPLATTRARVMASLAAPVEGAPVDRIKAADIEGLCSLVDVAEALFLLLRYDEAEAAYEAIRQGDPACEGATTSLALLLIDRQKGEAASALIEPLLAQRPEDPNLLMIQAAALRLRGRLTDAIDAVEKVVRNPEARHAGDMGTLLGMYLREGERLARLERWKRWHRDHPDDLVAPFMVGVLNHYENRFAASDAWLKPLKGRLEGEPRLYVYLSMNAFNLGRVEESRAHLDYAAGLEVVDPDVYYCRSEITRDTERDVSIADLERYLALTDGTPHASVPKQARVHEMLDALKRCRDEDIAACEGPFEHPRQPPGRWLSTNLVPLGMALLLAAFLGLLGRRRKRE